MFWISLDKHQFESGSVYNYYRGGHPGKAEYGSELFVCRVNSV